MARDFVSMPDEILLAVFRFLATPSLFKLALVSKPCRRLVSDISIWKEKIERYGHNGQFAS